jgi:RimK family alpha-L-glutamate ligase
MKAWLITNGFLNSAKFHEINQWLVEAGNRKGIEIIIRSNDQCLVELGEPSFASNEMDGLQERPDFILFWDKDIRLAKQLEWNGFRLFNSANAIEVCDDKSLTHMKLEQAHIPMPKTILAPMTFENIGYTNLDFLDQVIKQLRFPMVIKECFGSFGQQVYLVSNEQECLKKVKELEGKPILFQEFIQTSFARDIRLQVVGDEVVAAMYRYSDSGDFRANISNGGKMKPYNPTQEQIDLAIQSTKALGLDFAGVDLLFSQGDKPIVCEVNSNAHFKNIYDCTGINVADSIMNYISKQWRNV